MLHGFADPVFDSQSAFRRVMEAMANPGNIRRIAEPRPEAGGLPAAAMASVLAMCDFETPVYLSPSLRTRAGIADAIGFHTGAELTDEPAKALFAIVDPVADGLDLAGFALGTPEYPDRSTTIIVLCRALDAGPALAVSGPGVPSSRTLSPAGLPADFLAQMIANRAGFPLGVDVLLVAGDRMIGLPRSVRLTPGEA